MDESKGWRHRDVTVVGRAGDGGVGRRQAPPSEVRRENVLHGVTRRTSLPPDVPEPIRGPRLINVTFRVDDTTLNYARGRAVVEGTSVNALVCRLLEEYSGIARPPGQEISRRIPMFRSRQIRAVEGADDL